MHIVENIMRKVLRFCTLFLLTVILTACGTAQATSPAAGTGNIEVNWQAWSITWQTTRYLDSVTVESGKEHKTYVPEQDNFVFMAFKAEMLNISKETQEIRFPMGPIYVKDQEGNTYNLAGISSNDVFFTAPPYVMFGKTHLTMSRWDDGRFYLVAYQPEPGSWFIRATPEALFHVDFVFAVPREVSGLVMEFGNEMSVDIP
jgi:hypothetical protein